MPEEHPFVFCELANRRCQGLRNSRLTKIAITFEFSNFVDFLFQPAPSGIARVDLAYARFLIENPHHFGTGIHHRFGIKTLISLATLERLIATIDRNWNEDNQAPLGLQVEHWLRASDPTVRRIRAPAGRKTRFWRNVARLVTGWPWQGQNLRPPRNSIYLNTGYGNTEEPEKLAWLDKRPDITPVFLVYDLIPIDFPEFFWDGLEAAFQKKMDTILHHAKVVIVTATEVAERLAAYAHEKGRHDLVIHNIPLPPAHKFLEASEAPLAQSLPPYFVACSTIEPRKNHILLLNIWRKMAQDAIATSVSIPKLVIVGGRGWKNENVIDFLERSPALRGHVLEVSGLSTSDLKRLVTHARALLMPSFAEGFGLPVAEALSVGTPVIASDIPVFREVSQGCATLIDPVDGAEWQKAIMALASDCKAFELAKLRASIFSLRGWDDYFADVMRVLEASVENKR